MADLVGLQQDIVVQQSRLRIRRGHCHAEGDARQEYRRTVYDALSKAQQKAASLAQDVIKAEQRTKLQRLTAPVDGVVQQLAVHTVGGAATPASRSGW
jgi:hemolysin D